MNKVVPALVLLAVASALAAPPPEGKFPLFPGPRSTVDRESTHHYDVRLYQIDLTTTLTSGAFSARCRIELTPRHDNFDTFSLHFVNLVCDSIRREDNACTFTASSGTLLITLDRPFANGESLAVDVYYHRNAGSQNRGYYWYARGTQSIPHAVAYSVTEPNDSRYWFPCFDQPWDKAERGCRINITVPDSMNACANGVLDSVRVAGGWRTSYWRHSHPISTYLMCFAASHFTDWQVWWHYGADSMPVRYYVWPVDSVSGVSSFGRMTDMLDFFSAPARYGLYPFADEKYGMVAVYPYPWGGMEHQTMTTIHRYWVTNGSDNGIAHELSHQWWGDMVTCLDWRNIWLNEGFATYSDELYYYHRNGRSGFLSLIRSRADDYFDEEASDPHPIYDPPPGHEFDWGHSYCKGAWVQHMLRYVAGDTTWPNHGVFFAALREYGDSFRYANANTEDYRRILERRLDLDLGWFFDEWVYSLGYPRYTVGWYGRETTDGWEVVVDLAQNNMSGAPAVFHMPVEIRISWSGGDTLIRYPVAASPQRNVFPVPAQPTALEFDPNEWLLDQHSVQVGLTSEIDPALRIGRLQLDLGPNPCRNLTRLNFALPGTRDVRLEVFGLDGRLVRRFDCGRLSGGRHTLVWNLSDEGGSTLAPGVYVVRLTAGTEVVTGRIVKAD